MRTVLVINSGSSSIKYQLIDADTEQALASGLIERIGEQMGAITHKLPDAKHTREERIVNHEDGMALMTAMFDQYGPSLADANVVAVGHRVVQGGALFDGPVVIDGEVEAAIVKLAPLAPLHNPAHLQGIQAAKRLFPHIPHVAVFDTAFHRTLPPAAYTYAIPADLAQRFAIRRYGAHGTSHKYVSQRAAAFLGKPLEDVNTIVLHLGNGASACAVQGGRSVETSMGLTPLEGLVMGTRSGDIDPAVLPYLHREAGLSTAEIDRLLNRQSGLLGLAGSNDLRDVEAAAIGGDQRARVAIEVYCHRIRGYVGNYLAQLGRLDAIAFTAGVGENQASIRAAALAGLEHLGISVDEQRNTTAPRGEEAIISPDGAPVAVLVIPTNEELEITRQALSLL